MEFALVVIGILLLVCLPGLASGDRPSEGGNGRRTSGNASDGDRRTLIRSIKVRCEDEDFTLMSLVDAYDTQPAVRQALEASSGYYFANVFKKLLFKAFHSHDVDEVLKTVQFLESDHLVAKILRSNFREMVEETIATSSMSFLLESPCARVESVLLEIRALLQTESRIVHPSVLREWFKMLQLRQDSLADPDTPVDPAMMDFCRGRDHVSWEQHVEPYLRRIIGHPMPDDIRVERLTRIFKIYRGEGRKPLFTVLFGGYGLTGIKFPDKSYPAPGYSLVGKEAAERLREALALDSSEHV